MLSAARVTGHSAYSNQKTQVEPTIAANRAIALLNDPSAIDACLFDFDGTLAHEDIHSMKEAALLLDKVGDDCHPHKFIPLLGKRIVHHPDLVADILGNDVDPQTYGTLVGEIQLRNKLSGNIEWNKEVLELARFFTEIDKPIGIVTNSPRECIEAALSHLPSGLGLNRESFSVLVCVDDPNIQSKPHPSSYLRASAELKASKGGCLAVEDSRSGLAAAVAAGIPALGIPSLATSAEELSSFVFKEGLIRHVHVVNGISEVIQRMGFISWDTLSF